MISKTALLCALARAQHSHGKNKKIFEDKFAVNFLSLKDYRLASQLAENFIDKKCHNILRPTKKYPAKILLEKYFLPIILPRNRFAEDIVKEKLKEGRVQYVLLGAGLDSFALRNKSKNVDVFELDLPETQNFKVERMRKLLTQRKSNVHFVEIDFSKDSITDKLIFAGYNPKIPAVFSILGVSYYIPIEILFNTVSQVSEIASPKSALIFDYYEKEDGSAKGSENVETDITRLKQITAACGETMVEGYDPGEVAERMKSAGFKSVKDFSPKEIGERFFKNSAELSAFEGVHLVYGEKLSRGDLECEV